MIEIIWSIISENSYTNNINSLINTTKQIKKTEIINDSNNILKVKEKEYKSPLEGKTKKIPNYQFLADAYRRQINKAFVKYNPNIHLSSIRKLKETEPETDKESPLTISVCFTDALYSILLPVYSNSFSSSHKRVIVLGTTVSVSALKTNS